MAFSLNFDIYNWLLVEILKVQPTGDPVNDAVYLVLLPMVVLYMFVYDVTAKSRFKGRGLAAIIMFVMAFYIVRQGFYPLFAGFSLPLLILIMLWHTFDFIRGKASGEKTIKRGAPDGGSGGFISSIKDAINAPQNIRREIAGSINELTTHDISEAEKRLRELETEFNRLEGEIENAQKSPHAGELVNSLEDRESRIVRQAEDIKNDYGLHPNEMKKYAPNISIRLRIK